MALSIQQWQRKSPDEDWWAWAVWVEGAASELDQIDYVQYTLHKTFPKPVRRVTDRPSKFRLETGGWGEFTIFVLAVKKDGRQEKLQHRLRLTYEDGTECKA